MTNEEKQLLIKDLCGRLPYDVKIRLSYSDNGMTKYKNCILDCDNFKLCILNGKYKSYSHIYQHPDFNFKPYLRPMSSMTEEEEKEYYALCVLTSNGGYDWYYEPTLKSLDWLNAHHFDYRGLIPMGLALESPEGMYK